MIEQEYKDQADALNEARIAFSHVWDKIQLRDDFCATPHRFKQLIYSIAWDAFLKGKGLAK
jgi:hypothetical protein